MVKRTAGEWETLFAQQKESGLTQKQFCEREEISHYAFNSARRRASMRARGLTPSSPRRRKESTSATVEATRPDGTHLNCGQFIPVELVSNEGPPVSEKPDLTVELPYGITLRFHGLGQ